MLERKTESFEHLRLHSGGSRHHMAGVGCLRVGCHDRGADLPGPFRRVFIEQEGFEVRRQKVPPGFVGCYGLMFMTGFVLRCPEAGSDSDRPVG